MTFAGVVVLGYLLGSCPWGYWLVRIFRGEDIRKIGQRRHRRRRTCIRAYGPKLGIPVIVLDVLKGFVPAFVGVHTVSPLCGIVAGAAAMAGHYRPLFLALPEGREDGRDRGRRASSASRSLAALGAAVVWFVAFALTRYTSVASIVRGAVAADLGVRLRLPDVGDRPQLRQRRGRDLPAPREPAAPAHGHREPLLACACGARRTSSRWPRPEFSRLVTLACHDLRTPLATVNGFAKTLAPRRRARRAERALRRPDRRRRRADERPARPARPRRADRGRHATSRRCARSTRSSSSRSADERIGASGSGETIETDEPSDRRALGCARVGGAPSRRASSGRVDGRRPRAAARRR